MAGEPPPGINRQRGGGAVIRGLGPWLPPHGRWPLFLLLFVHAVALGQALFGRSDTFVALLLLSWSGVLASAFAMDSGGLGGPPPKRPDAPSGRVALASVAYCLLPANAWIAFGVLVSTPDFDWDWVWLVLVGSSALVGLAYVPDPAHWTLHWNREQADRVAAAEAALAAARTRVLHSQMQPHFLFNALNSVTALLRDDPARAREVLVSLKGLMERVRETSQDPMTTVRQEVAFVRDQLAIEQERFHDRLRVTVDVPDSLLDERVPAFSLQPLAENALRHGIAQSIEGGSVTVKVARDGHALVLLVENTGGGLSPGWREGTGLGNLRARLEAQYGRAASLTVGQSGDTTRAEIRIPHEPFGTLPSSKPLEV